MPAGLRRLYSALLSLYPASVREQFAEPMMRHLVDVWGDEAAHAGRLKQVWVTLRLVADMSMNAALAHVGCLFARRDNPMTQSRRLEWPSIRVMRLALRSLIRVPGYSLAFVVTLGLGIGANTAIFSIINGVLLRPLPYPDADRIMYLQHEPTGGGTLNTSLSFLEVDDYRTQARTIDEVVEFGQWTFNVIGRDDPHVTTAGLVTENFFRVLGLRPIIGRVLMADDHREGAEPVAVLTHEYWHRVMGADSSVLGQPLDLTVTQATIVGVLAPGSHYATMTRPLDFYANYASSDHYMGASMQDQRSHRMTSVFARRRPGVTVTEARTELTQIGERTRAAYPEDYPPEMAYQTVVRPWRDELTREARPMLLLLFGTAAFVLVIACANVANLTLTRLIRRERELAIRAALGAQRSQLRAQLLAENLVLSVGGAALGLVIAVFGLDVLVAYTARYTTRTQDISVDASVLSFTLVVAVGIAMLFAWAPRLAFTRRLGSALVASGGTRTTGSRSRRRAQRTLVVGQLAISFMLLVGAGLLVRSLIELSQVETGLDSENVLTMQIPDLSNRPVEASDALSQSMVERVGGHAGVHEVALSSGRPFEAFATQIEFRVENSEMNEAQARSMGTTRAVSAGYFATLGIPLLEGRDFTTGDGRTSQLVAIVNQSLANHYFPDQSAVGRRLQRKFSNGNWSTPWTIIGVVGDAREVSVDQEPVNTLYMSVAQRSSANALLLRASSEPTALVGPILQTVRELDPSRAIVDVQTLDQLRSQDIAPQRLNATLFGMFAVLALAIAAVGVAGVLAFSVSQRTHEFGIRVTLGADRVRVLWMVLREGVTLVGSGLVIGTVGALAVTRMLSGLLFDVRPSDPLTFVIVAGVLGSVALAAAMMPARRATRVNPIEALRAE